MALEKLNKNILLSSFSAFFLSLNLRNVSAHPVPLISLGKTSSTSKMIHKLQNYFHRSSRHVLFWKMTQLSRHYGIESREDIGHKASCKVNWNVTCDYSSPAHPRMFLIYRFGSTRVFFFVVVFALLACNRLKVKTEGFYSLHKANFYRVSHTFLQQPFWRMDCEQSLFW